MTSSEATSLDLREAKLDALDEMAAALKGSIRLGVESAVDSAGRRRFFGPMGASETSISCARVKRSRFLIKKEIVRTWILDSFFEDGGRLDRDVNVLRRTGKTGVVGTFLGSEDEEEVAPDAIRKKLKN